MKASIPKQRQPRTRTPEYRARRRQRHAQRRMRGADRRDAQLMLEMTPGYGEMLERMADSDRLYDLATGWERHDEQLV